MSASGQDPAVLKHLERVSTQVDLVEAKIERVVSRLLGAREGPAITELLEKEYERLTEEKASLNSRLSELESLLTAMPAAPTPAPPSADAEAIARELQRASAALEGLRLELSSIRLHPLQPGDEFGAGAAPYVGPYPGTTAFDATGTSYSGAATTGAASAAPGTDASPFTTAGPYFDAAASPSAGATATPRSSAGDGAAASLFTTATPDLGTTAAPSAGAAAGPSTGASAGAAAAAPYAGATASPFATAAPFFGATAAPYAGATTAPFAGAAASLLTAAAPYFGISAPPYAGAATAPFCPYPLGGRPILADQWLGQGAQQAGIRQAWLDAGLAAQAAAEAAHRAAAEVATVAADLAAAGEDAEEPAQEAADQAVEDAAEDVAQGAAEEADREAARAAAPVVPDQEAQDQELCCVLAAMAPSSSRKDLMHFIMSNLFACPNGHLYIIDGGGTAILQGGCPECGAVVGGSSNRLAQGNQHAPEEVMQRLLRVLDKAEAASTSA